MLAPALSLKMNRIWLLFILTALCGAEIAPDLNSAPCSTNPDQHLCKVTVVGLTLDGWQLQTLVVNNVINEIGLKKVVNFWMIVVWHKAQRGVLFNPMKKLKNDAAGEHVEQKDEYFSPINQQLDFNFRYVYKRTAGRFPRAVNNLVIPPPVPEKVLVIPPPLPKLAERQQLEILKSDKKKYSKTSRKRERAIDPKKLLRQRDQSSTGRARSRAYQSRTAVLRDDGDDQVFQELSRLTDRYGIRHRPRSRSPFVRPGLWEANPDNPHNRDHANKWWYKPYSVTVDWMGGEVASGGHWAVPAAGVGGTDLYEGVFFPSVGTFLGIPDDYDYD